MATSGLGNIKQPDSNKATIILFFANDFILHYFVYISTHIQADSLLFILPQKKQRQDATVGGVLEACYRLEDLGHSIDPVVNMCLIPPLWTLEQGP